MDKVAYPTIPEPQCPGTLQKNQTAADESVSGKGEMERNLFPHVWYHRLLEE